MTAKPIAGYPSRTDACFALRAKGYSTRQISEKLGITTSTVSALIATRLKRADPDARPERPLHENGRTVVISNDVLDALVLPAAQRGISVNQIVRNILAQVVDDGIVDAVLDDAENLPSLEPRQVAA